MKKICIVVPNGFLAADSTEDAAAKRRKELANKLLRGEEVVVTQEGEVKDKGEKRPGEAAITVPEGKLAASFYWYERDRALYDDEIVAMKRFYPQFKLEKLSDGRLSWVGTLTPKSISPGSKWILQAVYDNNHPSNSNYGGSIKVYAIHPDLQELATQLGSIPHTLRDSSGKIYICTARKEDFKSSYNCSTSAASALSWAAKWITAFVLWMEGDLSTSDFASHSI